MWEKYRNINPNAPKDYDAWAFGNSKEMADELVALVLAGTKTATASLYMLFELENEVLPYAGLHNIILDGAGNAVAIIETTDIEVVPFDEVTAKFAYLEGEGDRSLAYWRDVHKTFFEQELDEINEDFNDEMLVVCEKFKLIYKNH